MSVTRRRSKRDRSTVTHQKDDNGSSIIAIHDLHQFTPEDTIALQLKLLEWYKCSKRDLPWRSLSSNGDPLQRAYAVLVSEVMLQQTQVVTVKQYYKKWMTRWPTFQDLARASLEEVNEMWAGLGYYARGRRLHEAAKKVVGELGGKLPHSAEQLQRQLPGVGQYTAGAVASITFGEKVAAVDGNVIRVLARLRLIGGDSSSQGVMKGIWNLAESIVSEKHPGDFNEAMMELGAVICTPKLPKCSHCPVKDLCQAHKLTKSPYTNDKNYSLPDIETVPDCCLCLPVGEIMDPSLGVMNFPRKSKKAPPRNQESVVCILHRRNNRDQEDEYFLVKRLSDGLLANLWEFPTFVLKPVHSNKWTFLQNNLKDHHGVKKGYMESNECIGEVVHHFSHIYQVYVVYAVRVGKGCVPQTSDNYQNQQWVSEKQFITSAVSSGMKKIFKIFCSKGKKESTSRKRTRGSSRTENDMKKKSVLITDFYTKGG